MIRALPQKRHAALAQDGVVKDQPGRPARHGGAHMQGQQVFLAGVTGARVRGLLPGIQSRLAFGLRKSPGTGLDKPVLEGVVGRIRRSAAQTKRDRLWYENPEPTAKCSRSTGRPVSVRGRCAPSDRTALQRELQHGMSAAGVHQAGEDEQPWSNRAGGRPRRNAAPPSRLTILPAARGFWRRAVIA